MGIKPAIVIYTHTDYSDIWPALFSRLAKYMSSYKVNIFVNEKHKQIPQTYNVITYDNNLIYTERLKSCLKELDDDLIQNSGGDFMYKTENEVKRGVYHCDSIIFPYISTAIVKGKWNESEYKNELNSVFTEFNINKTIRGVI